MKIIWREPYKCVLNKLKWDSPKICVSVQTNISHFRSSRANLRRSCQKKKKFSPVCRRKKSWNVQLCWHWGLMCSLRVRRVRQGEQVTPFSHITAPSEILSSVLLRRRRWQRRIDKRLKWKGAAGLAPRRKISYPPASSELQAFISTFAAWERGGSSRTPPPPPPLYKEVREEYCRAPSLCGEVWFVRDAQWMFAGFVFPPLI